VWLLAFAVAGSVFAWIYLHQRSDAARLRAQEERIAPAPDFSFTAQDGRTFGLKDLHDKVWIATFIFTRCAGPCPVISRHMAELNRVLADKADVRLVSFTVDPEHDTPEVLSGYGEALGADPTRWVFLTGQQKELEHVIVKGMLQPLGKDREGVPMHSTQFVVVDREGYIRHYRSLEDAGIVENLVTDVGALLSEPHAPQPSATPAQ